MSVRQSPRGILAYGAYVPAWRLARQSIGMALGTAAVGRGSRSVAGYDEDTTSMAVEAARVALHNWNSEITSVLFATADPAYQDKTNATAISAALALGDEHLAVDFTGAVRSGVGAMHAGLHGDASLVVLSDMRTGLPGSADEIDGGDAAAALVMGSGTAGPLLAELIGSASITGEFLDRWRAPGERYSRVWEERFGESNYLPLADRALASALRDAELSVDRLNHVVLAGLHTRALRSVAKSLADQRFDELRTVIGNTGTAHAAVALTEALDVAEPDEVIAVIVLADGVDVLLFRTTGELSAARSVRPLRAQVAAGRADLSYSTFLTWRGMLRREPPRRPNPERPAGPPSRRMEPWKYGFTGTRCRCGQVHLPPQRVCVTCGLVDQMTETRLADVPATIATYTVDHLAFSPSPPVLAAVIDFDGGGRFACEITDAVADDIEVGTRVEMTFRRLYTADGVHNYFWKARPLAPQEAS